MRRRNGNGAAPRGFLPSDPRVIEPYRLTPKLALRLGMLGFLALAIFAILFLRLWALQVLQGNQYLRAAQNNQLRTVRLEAQRGVIFDREGRVLVGNVAGTALQLWPADLPEKGRYQMLQRLSKVIGVPADRMAREVDERIDDPLNPVTVKEVVTEAEVRYLSERRTEFAGVVLADTYLRHYPYGALAPQTLGHVGEITKDQLKLRRFGALEPGDKIGQSGVEAAFDRYLRGRPGLAKVRVDSLGRPLSPIETAMQPRAGQNVTLTIDARLQRAAEQALVNGIDRALRSGAYGAWNANGGAIVALDARNGEILALASNPTYDPRIFVGRPNPWRLRPLVNQNAAKAANYPGVNRAIAGVYPPGSTFKPVTAIAALEEREVLPYQSLPCTPLFTFRGENGVLYKFKNWDPYVDVGVTMTDALARSCDTYFYQLGLQFYELQTSPLQEWAMQFGFGEKSGIEIGPEEAGLIPTPKWREDTFDDPIEKLWKPGDSIQLAIGQKDTLVTPIQMARFYALVANGGKLVTPHLLRDVQGPGNLSLVPHPPSPAPQQIDVSSGALAVIRQGLLEATHSPNGTATPVFGSFPIPIAGKTGTAEKLLPEYKRLFDQAWWCGYGPADDPRIVVCALIENGGHGGSVAAPAAREVFEAYFGIDVGEAPTVHESETD